MNDNETISQHSDDDEGVVVGGEVLAAVAGGATAGAVADAVPAEGGGGAGGGTPPGGGSGGGGGAGSGDDDKLFADLPVSGDRQVVVLGLIVAALMLFGSTIWGWFTGDDSPVDIGGAIGEVENVDSFDGDSDSGFVFGASDDTNDNGDDDAAQTATAADTDAGADATTTSTAAPTTTTTTTEAPTTTTTEAATTTQAPTTTVAAAFTMWDALAQSGEAAQFATVGAALGLQADLEAIEDADGNPVSRTLFALSDESMALLDVPALASDPEGAQALVGYHFVDERLLAADLVALDGETILTRTGLPLSISVDDQGVLLNGSSRVISADLESDNGVIHVITPALTPPTINEIIDLQNIEFEVNSDVITAAGQAELQKAIDFFTVNADVSARIEGHTDTDGDEALNQDLSDRRAIAVKTFLVENGVNGDNLTTIGFGETQPILVDGVEDKAASRRIEFNVR